MYNKSSMSYRPVDSRWNNEKKNAANRELIGQFVLALLIIENSFHELMSAWALSASGKASPRSPLIALGPALSARAHAFVAYLTNIE